MDPMVPDSSDSLHAWARAMEVTSVESMVATGAIPPSRTKRISCPRRLIRIEVSRMTEIVSSFDSFDMSEDNDRWTCIPSCCNYKNLYILLIFILFSWGLVTGDHHGTTASLSKAIAFLRNRRRLGNRFHDAVFTQGPILRLPSQLEGALIKELSQTFPV